MCKHAVHDRWDIQFTTQGKSDLELRFPRAADVQLLDQTG